MSRGFVSSVCVLLAATALAVSSPEPVDAQVRVIPTREVDPPGRQPYSTSFGITLTSGNGTNGFSPDPIPATKRLVIEFVSVNVLAEPNEKPRVFLNDLIDGHSRNYWIPLTLVESGPSIRSEYWTTQLVKLYVDGNGVNGPGGTCARTMNAFTQLQCSFTISGYLIDK